MWQLAIPILAALFGPALTGSKNRTGAVSTATTDPMLRELLQMQQGRMNQSQPLYDAIMKMAMGLMPTQYQQPIGGLAQPTTGLTPPSGNPIGFTDGSDERPMNPDLAPGA